MKKFFVEIQRCRLRVEPARFETGAVAGYASDGAFYDTVLGVFSQVGIPIIDRDDEPTQMMFGKMNDAVQAMYGELLGHGYLAVSTHTHKAYLEQHSNRADRPRYVHG